MIIRETCCAEYDPTTDMAAPDTLLRYHSAIFILFVNHITQACADYVAATGPDTDTIRFQCLSTIEHLRQKIVDAGTQGWLDTTPLNSGYSAPYLRTRLGMLTSAIKAHNASDDLQSQAFVR
jgi:hypothetical protein